MRDLIVFAVVIGLIPVMLRRPAVGVLTFTWISLMNPHRLAYGAAFDFPFAAAIAGFTSVSLILTKEPKNLPVNPITLVLLVFAAWTTATTFQALEPAMAWDAWGQFMKMLFMILVAMLVINSEKDIKAFAWILALSLGFYGVKGGIFTLLSGGVNRVFGPPGTNIGDNNDLALALVVVLPIIWYLHLQAPKGWLRKGLFMLAFLTLVAAVGTYSRGAFLAGSAMLSFLWLKNEKKTRNALVLLMFVAIIFSFMPDKWFSRMQTIDDYQNDASALGRINAWNFAVNVAKSHIMGGGFRVFTPQMFFVYAPNPKDFHAPHSIYFQVLGDHGFIGLILFLLLMAMAWRTGTRIKRLCEGKIELKWASDLALMTQTSMVGYVVGGAFLSLAYFDLYYNLIVLLFVLDKFLAPLAKENRRSKIYVTAKNTYPSISG